MPWRRMREEAPLYRNERWDLWALTRFQDVLDEPVNSESAANPDSNTAGWRESATT